LTDFGDFIQHSVKINNKMMSHRCDLGKDT